MKILLGIALYFILTGCMEKGEKISNEIDVVDSPSQSSIFKQLLTITDHKIPIERQQDSLLFLIIPVQASCPSCLEKTIDSLLKYQQKLPVNRYVIISANGGQKTINYFFRKQDGELRGNPDRVFLDSIDQAGNFKMYENNPAIYFTANQKAYKKVFSKPATIKHDLRMFFSGKAEKK